MRLGEYEAAVQNFRTQDGLKKKGDPIARYNVACAYALQNKRLEAMKWLEAATDAGCEDFKHSLQDPDLANLHDYPAFQQMCGGSAE